MPDSTHPVGAEREESLGGIGCARKRKEDIRFIQGKGNYVDDIKLKGMVHGDFVRSPYAHARIKGSTRPPPWRSRRAGGPDRRRPEAAQPALDADPGRRHPAVLADEKVHFQNQEVAFVIGETATSSPTRSSWSRSSTRSCRPLVDPRKAMDDDAPILREDVKDKTEVRPRRPRHHNHIFTWEVGDKDATEAAFDRPRSRSSEEITYQRVHPVPAGDLRVASPRWTRSRAS